MEFTHGEIIAKNGEDGGTGRVGQERGTWQTELRLRQQTRRASTARQLQPVLCFEATGDKWLTFLGAMLVY